MDKDALRKRVWDHLEDSGEARFPFPPHGRIPNFAGAEAAAERLFDVSEWMRAGAIKANPDSPQRPVRRRAMTEGTPLYMAVPRLADPEPFLEQVDVADPDDASTLSGVDGYGVPVGPDAVPPIDLIVVGSVAVTPDGARVGKGEGYSDLEFAVLSELGAVGPDTTIATTAHELQVVDDPGRDDDLASVDVGVQAHDVPLDLICTPERTLWTDPPHDRPDGIYWDDLDEETVAEIPVLERLRT